MIAVALAWPAVVTAVEAVAGECAGWIATSPPIVRLAAVTDDGAWTDDALVALAAPGAAPAALFHSHPDGRAALSARDRAAWAPTGVPLWPWPQLVIATRGGRAVAAALYAWPAAARAPHAVASLARDDDGAWRARR